MANSRNPGSGDLRLFLSGGGGAEESKDLDREFVHSLKSNSILYVPVGLVRDLSGYDECYEWICRTLNVFGRLLDISMWVDLKRKSYSDLRKFSAIYVGGANNSYRLMGLFESSGFASSLRNFFANGGTVYGGSTGAILMGKYFSVFGEEPIDGYNSPYGFGFAGDYSVFCHYTKSREYKIVNFIDEYHSPVLAIPERSGVAIDEAGEANVIGKENVFLFNSKTGRTTVGAGNSFAL
ncbi:MAG: Type 1 glutamine amidotransferase-like domain-containing protein [Patescibacteria group bacterium]